MAIRTPRAALRWCRLQSINPFRDWTGYCLIFSRSAYNVASKYPSAAIASRHAKIEGHDPYKAPPGAIHWWTGGAKGYGHVTVGAGEGWCWTNDFKRRGKINKVLVAAITRGWGQHYVGWSYDVNDVQVYFPLVLDASLIQRAARRNGTCAGAKALKKAVNKELGILTPVVDGKLGRVFKRRYKKIQRKYALETGRAVTGIDGLPGLRSLTWLGDRHYFKVVE